MDANENDGLDILAAVATATGTTGNKSFPEFSKKAQEGLCHEKNTQYEAAIICYKEAEKVCPSTSFDALCGLLYQHGRMLLKMNRCNEAVPFLQKTLVTWEKIPVPITLCLEDKGCHKTLIHYTLAIALSRANSYDSRALSHLRMAWEEFKPKFNHKVTILWEDYILSEQLHFYIKSDDLTVLHTANKRASELVGKLNRQYPSIKDTKTLDIFQMFLRKINAINKVYVQRLDEKLGVDDDVFLNVIDKKNKHPVQMITWVPTTSEGGGSLPPPPPTKSGSFKRPAPPSAISRPEKR